MLDFSQKAEERNNDLIPKGTLLWVVINCRGVRDGRNPNKIGKYSRYLDLELTIDDNQPYARRKIWTMVGDPLHAGNTDEYKNMGLASIRRILETAFGSNPENPDSYKVLTDYAQLTGKRVAVKVTIDKGQDGHEDKNNVEFLSPYSSVKSVVKSFNDLKEGKHAAANAQTAATASAQAGFGFAQAAPATAQATQPAWLAQAGSDKPPF